MAKLYSSSAEKEEKQAEIPTSSPSKNLRGKGLIQWVREKVKTEEEEEARKPEDGERKSPFSFPVREKRREREWGHYSHYGWKHDSSTSSYA